MWRNASTLRACSWLVLIAGLGAAPVLVSAETGTCDTLTWGGNGDDLLLGVVRAPSGFLYGNGNSSSFGLGDEDQDVLLFRFDENGSIEWVKRWGGVMADDAEGLALGPSGDVYMTGYTRSFTGAGKDLFVLKFSGDGVLDWAKTWDWDGDEDADVIVIDATGDLYVAGSTTTSFDPRTKALLVKISPAGSMLWGRTWERAVLPGEDSVNGMVIDSAGDLVLVGNTTPFGGAMDALLLKFNAMGDLLREKSWGGSQNDDAFNIVANGSGALYVTGATESFGEGGRDVFLLKLSPVDGTDWSTDWSRAWGSSGTDDGGGLALGPTGDVYLTGSTDSFGNVDGFAARFDPNGNFQLARTWGVAGDDAFGNPSIQHSWRAYFPGITASCGSVARDVRGVVTPDIGAVSPISGNVSSLLKIEAGSAESGSQFDPTDTPGCAGLELVLTVMARTCIVMSGPDPTLTMGKGDCDPASSTGSLELIRGSLGELRLSGGSVDLGSVECVSGGALQVDRITEMSANPCPGAWFYLARHVGDPNFGTASTGEPRDVMSSDPPCP